MLAQRHARCQNGLPLGRRSCDGARATSSVSIVATLAPRSQESRRQVKSLHEVLQCHPSWAVIDAWQWDGSRSSSESTVGRAKLVKTPPVGLRCPATDFEQVCGAAQAALRISRVVSDVVRAHGVAGGRYGEI